MHFADVVERRFMVHVVRRTNMLFDTRFAMPGRPRGLVDVFAVRRGWLEVDGVRTPGPALWVLDEGEFALGATAPPHLRIGGEVCDVVDVQLARADVRRPIGVRHGPVPLAPAAWRAFDAALDTATSTAPTATIAPTMAALIATLGDAGVVAPDLAATLTVDEPAAFRRLEAAMAPLLADFTGTMAVDAVAEAAGVSARQLSRDVAELAATFGLIGDGLRDSSLRLRLRIAVLLLSVPDVTATMVARHLGYSSLPAFATALRNAGLPSPQEIQHAVRGAVA